MNLVVNMLIEWQTLEDDKSGLRIERILWIDSSLTQVITIEIFGRRSVPILRTYEALDQAIAVRDARILETDPFASLRRPEDSIKKKHRIHRDKAWKMIAPLVGGDDAETLVNPRKRALLIAKLIQSRLGCEATIYKYWRRYLQRGMIKNALLPAFNKCGAPGKRRFPDPKKYEEQKREPMKLGRPSALAKVTPNPIGVRITEGIEEKFKRGITKFYEKSDCKDLTDAYDRTLETFFRTTVALVKGIPTPILPPAEQLPTFRQFQYWYETYYRDFGREKKAREGEKEYNLSGRALLGDSTQMAFGPGSLYQIDATIADIYLVNSFDESRIIGRPVIYACIDVFSRMVTGICVTLEGPSWIGAMLALDNVVTDKVAFCAEYGITIEKDDWPCYRLPNAILADRGEFEGYDADSLPNSLGVRIHNTGPYRADWKGIVERHFGIANENFIHFTPGAVPRPWKRGDPDYALKAVHTLDAFRKLLIYHVLHYNHYYYLKTYKKNEYMIADDVDRYPIDFWNWGIRKRNGHLEPLPQDIIRLNLLPRKEVSVTPNGIHFAKELFYKCDYANDRGWFDKARIRSNWKIEISYDPRRVDYIYLPLDDRTRLERCNLTPASKAYLGRDLHDAMDNFEYEMRKEESSRTRRQQSKSVFHAQIDLVNAESTKKAKAAR